MKRTKTYINQKGMTLVEVVVAVGVIVVVLTGFMTSMTKSLGNVQFAKNKTLATKYAQEGMEWVRGQRDQTTWPIFYDYAGPPQASVLPSPSATPASSASPSPSPSASPSGSPKASAQPSPSFTSLPSPSPSPSPGGYCISGSASCIGKNPGDSCGLGRICIASGAVEGSCSCVTASSSPSPGFGVPSPSPSPSPKAGIPYFLSSLLSEKVMATTVPLEGTYCLSTLTAWPAEETCDSADPADYISGTPFLREISLYGNGSDDRVTVVAVVSWQQGGKQDSVTLTTYLTDWQ